MALFETIDRQLFTTLAHNGDIEGQLRMIRSITDHIKQIDPTMPDFKEDLSASAQAVLSLAEQAEAVRRLIFSGTNDHDETDINFFTDVYGRDLCIDCAIIELWCGDVERFEAVNSGKDQSCKDVFERSYSIEHEASIQFESFPGDYLKDGVTCARCATVIVEPKEEEEEEEEEDHPF